MGAPGVLAYLISPPLATSKTDDRHRLSARIRAGGRRPEEEDEDEEHLQRFSAIFLELKNGR